MSEGRRRLLLLRHAKAVTAQPGAPDAFDHARALSERGRAQAMALGPKLQAQGLLPELALVSTSRRTRETFERLGLGDARLVLSGSLYLASAAGLLEALREQAGAAGSVLVIGHNPGLHELALCLSGGNAVLAQGFPTCTLAAFTIAGEWSELAPREAHLNGLLRP